MKLRKGNDLKKGFACKTKLAILCSLVIWASIWHVVVYKDQQGTLTSSISVVLWLSCIFPEVFLCSDDLIVFY